VPNVKSAIKRHRTNLIRNQRNRQCRSRMRTSIKKLRKAKDFESALKLLPQVFSVIDKNAKKGVIHKRTAARYKSRLTRYVAKMQQEQTA